MNHVEKIRAAVAAGWRSLIRHQGLVAVLFALLVLVVTTLRHDLHAATSPKNTPMFVRDGERIRVPAGSPLRERLTIANVGAAGATHVLTVPGLVEADPLLTANIFPPLTGRVTRILVNLGDTVKSGQILAWLNAPDLTQAVADLKKAQDAQQLAKSSYQRVLAVSQAGATAQKDLDQTKSALAQANAELDRAQERLNALGGSGAAPEGSLLAMRSPTNGVVTAINAGVGALANDPTTALMTIANTDSVFVTASVEEGAAAEVVKGVEAEVTLPGLPNQKLSGTLTSVSNILDPDTRRLRARIRFANSGGRLKPNMFANVALKIKVDPHPAVPESALLMNNDSTTVFVEVEPWVFVRRRVEMGSEDGQTVQITAGLRQGERVIVRGAILLND